MKNIKFLILLSLGGVLVFTSFIHAMDLDEQYKIEKLKAQQLVAKKMISQWQKRTENNYLGLSTLLQSSELDELNILITAQIKKAFEEISEVKEFNEVEEKVYFPFVKKIKEINNALEELKVAGAEKIKPSILNRIFKVLQLKTEEQNAIIKLKIIQILELYNDIYSESKDYVEKERYLKNLEKQYLDAIRSTPTELLDDVLIQINQELKKELEEANTKKILKSNILSTKKQLEYEIKELSNKMNDAEYDGIIKFLNNEIKKINAIVEISNINSSNNVEIALKNLENQINEKLLAFKKEKLTIGTKKRLIKKIEEEQQKYIKEINESSSPFYQLPPERYNKAIQFIKDEINKIKQILERSDNISTIPYDVDNAIKNLASKMNQNLLEYLAPLSPSEFNSSSFKPNISQPKSIDLTALRVMINEARNKHTEEINKIFANAKGSEFQQAQIFLEDKINNINKKIDEMLKQPNMDYSKIEKEVKNRLVSISTFLNMFFGDYINNSKENKLDEDKNSLAAKELDVDIKELRTLTEKEAINKIETGYRKKILQFHPDKVIQKIREQIENRIKKEDENLSKLAIRTRVDQEIQQKDVIARIKLEQEEAVANSKKIVNARETLIDEIKNYFNNKNQ